MIKMTTILHVAALWSATTTRPRMVHAFAFSSTSSWLRSASMKSSTRTNKEIFRNIQPTVVKPYVSSSSSIHSMASSKDTESINDVGNEKVPITLLSGFLGSGKTSTLQHLLENTDGVKIGVIVNDVASVNIDAKLVSSTSTSGVVELQNGCACCSLADELLTSVEQVLSVQNNDDKDKTTRSLDAVVVELSGVADPMAIKSNWNNAKMIGHPITTKADVSNVVTVVDASTFGTDWMTWDVAGEREGWVKSAEIDECSAERKVPELLAEQVEAADVILINKIDLAGSEQVQIATELAESINDKNATVEQVAYGRVSPTQILKDYVTNKDSEDVEAASSCDDPNCTDETHSHAHTHHHHHDNDVEGESVACNDPDCTDTSHSHEHIHAAATSTEDLGIVNFVYKANRPFNTPKLLKLLNKWPVPIKDYLDLDQFKEAREQGYDVGGRIEFDSPFVGVLRSKGFCWFAPTKWNGNSADPWRHDTAMYWSHAGKHFGISSAGKWWGTIAKEQMKKYFADDPKEYNRILREDFVSEEFQDRRQEIVFIGVDINEEEITAALDSCLLSKEKGMGRYRQELQNYMNRILSAEAFPPGLGPGLFDVGGGTEHLDSNN